MDQCVDQVVHGLAVVASHHVAQIADVAVLVLRSAVLLAERVVVAA
jgi:hypothetical protein